MIKVTFDIDNADDRANVRLMLDIYEPADTCGADCSHGTPSGYNGMTDDMAAALEEIVVDSVAKEQTQFAASLPGDDGSEECDVDPAEVGFGEVGNVSNTADAPTPDATVPASDATTVSAPSVVPQVGTVTAPLNDANGLPWDERIHSSSKNLNADGTWRTKRGLNPIIKNQVEAELRATKAAQGVYALPPTGNVPPPPPAPIAGAAVTPEATPAAVPSPVTTATAPPPPVPQAAVSDATFAKALMAMSGAKWSREKMSERVGAYGHTVQSLGQAGPDVWGALIIEAQATS